VTDHELTLLLVLVAVAVVASGLALAGWPTWLHWRRRPRGWRQLP
jgi:Flp pilus assembly pilin Flp